MRPRLIFLSCWFFLASCGLPSAPTATLPQASVAVESTALETSTLASSALASSTLASSALASSTPTAATSQSPAKGAKNTPTAPPGTALPNTTLLPAALEPGEWQELPVLPVVSQRAIEIYRTGQALGNNSHAFSKIGDCGSTPAWFLGDFDNGPQYYNLGEYTYLVDVIEIFQGSYSRTSLAAKSGFNAASVFSPLWSDPQSCQPDEAPLACEYRLHRPAFALITLGTNDVWHMDTFEEQMRKIIEFSIDGGVLPILATKADNEEGDGSINATIASLAREYQLPLWNYWKAVQMLPNRGLQEDGAHITWAPNRFNDPQVMRAGWPVRNLTALQVLDIVWKAVAEP